MRKPEQTSEPSIEEILASIRRIIADDGSRASEPAFEAPLPAAAREQAEAQYAGVQRDGFWPEGDFGAGEPVPSSAGEDEILELTEDFMVEEAVAAAARRAMEQAGEEPEAARTVEYVPGYQDYVEDEDAPPSAPVPEIGEAELEAPGMIAMEAPLTSEGLDSVLSNVVAEMRRLSEGQGLDAAKGFDPYEEEEEMPEPEPEPEPEQEAAWQPPRRPAQAGPVQRPVWSARHLDGGGAAARDAKAAEAVGREPLPRPAADDVPDLAAALPEAGPGAPFFALPGEKAEPISAAESAAHAADEIPASAPTGSQQSTLEEERRAVGETLTRAFSQTPLPEETETPGDARGLQAKAAEIAKTAVSDFAAEKLSAPPVAHALRADKPFMAEITTSLAGALARKAEQQKGSSETAEPELPESALASGAEAQTDAAEFGAAPEAPPLDAARVEAPHEEPEEVPAFPKETVAEEAEAPALVEARPERKPGGSSTPAFEAASGLLPEGLEAAVVEMLKPLIMRWLNDNLPRLVEKALREEVAANGPLMQRASKTNGARG
jgi:cell pole-organizing protein PopZ